MDVHPPLAKMLIALTGWLAGFDGEFDFKEIGKDYLEPGVPYVAMRMFPALCGILLAPLMFLTLKSTGCRTTTALLGSGLIIFGELLFPHHSNPYKWLTGPRRERLAHPGSADPSRLAPDGRHRLYCPCLHLVYEPARTRPRESIPAELVVLAGHDWSWTGHDCQHQMGRPVHHCLGRYLDPGPALGSAGRHSHCHLGKLGSRNIAASLS